MNFIDSFSTTCALVHEAARLAGPLGTTLLLDLKHSTVRCSFSKKSRYHNGLDLSREHCHV